MFSFRRRSSKKAQDASQIRTSPSLPELNSEGIPWPKNLVDVASIRQTPPPDHPQQGAVKTSFQGVDSSSTIPFHKPFRGSPGKPHDGPIFSLYMSNPPSAFDRHKNEHASISGRYSQKRARVPPTFNLMVTGARGTGKTSLLRLLLETADVSPTATVDQRAAADRFLRGTTKPTSSIQTACVEICESKFDRILLTVIDTPGLEFGEGRELKLERQVNGVMKYIDAQYADTMSEESKVVRQSKGDQHIHLCIYMIDPTSVMTDAARRASASLPTRSRSEATVSNHLPDLIPDVSGESDDDDTDAALTMSPAEIRVIRRISARCNVIPIIAHADSLTDDKLTAVKEAVRQGLRGAGLDFGVFAPATPSTTSPSDTPKRQTRFTDSNGSNPPTNGDAHASEEEDEEERNSRPVVRLRPSKHRALSRSRSRRDLSEAALDVTRPILPDIETDSVANVRFSAHVVARTDFSDMMPFAVITPESTARRARPISTASQVSSVAPSTPAATSDDGHSQHTETVPMTPASVIASSRRNSAYLDGPPDDLKGVFVRKYRWGTIDVLNPDHCDFAALRTAVLSTHLKVLKIHTKEVLYEKYRTEKLLARRATSHITEKEQIRLFEELGL
ncbi:hypothetical protein PLEOSDRAFT_1057992 [Pleurotus ostreatus PC15]|uniref:Septin-type G domain-containing protein n=1 Tax=Pleurotus ostreatus (strain PC15) TaxID=1137138 RepID=A0A067NNR3_PLEO1|nr:hypothetical protein PLEOSDRAFT_1057992 [Pleurotus ostreatus PC15]